jgi:hypothetical protein
MERVRRLPWHKKLDTLRHSIAKVNHESKQQIHIGFARCHRCDGVYRFLSAAGIKHDYAGSVVNGRKVQESNSIGIKK